MISLIRNPSGLRFQKLSSFSSSFLMLIMADVQGYSIILFLIGAISTFFTLVQFKYGSAKSKSALPPLPNFALPLVGHLHLLAPSPHRAFHKLSGRYGPVFRLLLGSKTCIVFGSPETAEELFKTHDSVFSDRVPNPIWDYVTYGGRGILLASYGSYWKFLKKTVVQDLLNSKTLYSLLPVRRDEMNHFLQSLSRYAKAGKSVDVEGELMKMTNNVISRMLMSTRCSSEENAAEDIRDIITKIVELTLEVSFHFSEYIWLFKKFDIHRHAKRSRELQARFDAYIEYIIRKHEKARKDKKESGDIKDLLNILLDISEDESMEIKLTRDNIKAFILDIFGAGTDTPARTVVWAMAELINHPNIMKKAVEEIDQVVGIDRLLQESDIPNLPYLRNIVKESLRLHPTVPLIQRHSIEDCTVGGYHIPAKTTVFFNVWGVGQDATLWDNPLEFRPERFKENQIDLRGQHYNLLPFGSGRRVCPGTSLALMVVHVALGSMIQCFDWKAGKDGNLTSVDMEEGMGTSLCKANPLVCVPVLRLDSIPLST